VAAAWLNVACPQDSSGHATKEREAMMATAGTAMRFSEIPVLSDDGRATI
jgi:hypothetical protein